jgi:hypothetical protein
LRSSIGMFTEVDHRSQIVARTIPWLER